jgi:sec-independent protein translocase protein TatC
MSLRDHLAELRKRLLKAGLAIVAASAAGWYLFSPLVRILQRPLSEIADENHITAQLTYTDIMQAFNLHIRIAVYLGLVLASPVWLYQSWAFIVPGLTRKEKRRAMTFAAAGTPLFLAGIYVGWMVVPNAVHFFGAFLQSNTSLLIPAAEYLDFVTRVLLIFGVAFLLPLVLVALNLAGVLPAKVMAKGWRLSVFGIFVFAAIAAPGADAGSMLALALPMVGLYVAAVGIATLFDRRKARNDPFAGLADDEASPLSADGGLAATDDLGAVPALDGAEPVRAPSPLGERDGVSAGGPGTDTYDDVL